MCPCVTDRDRDFGKKNGQRGDRTQDLRVSGRRGAAGALPLTVLARRSNQLS
jgi:hypothetical protein